MMMPFVNTDGTWNTSNPAVAAVMASERPSVGDCMTDLKKSKTMQDGGKRLLFTDNILKLGRMRPKPQARGEFFARLDEFFGICAHEKLTPIFPLFCVWCGMGVDEATPYAKSKGLANEFGVCKDTIRGYLELAALDNTLSPLIYFHQQKVYFGAVETSRVEVDTGPTDEQRLAEIGNLLASIVPPQMKDETIKVENILDTEIAIETESDDDFIPEFD
jgi:hypothetical protein